MDEAGGPRSATLVAEPRALGAGKHVVCEKPLALDVAQAAALSEKADASGRIATVPFVYRYHPTALEARARIAAGELGALRLLHGGYLQDWLSTPEDDNWRVDPQLRGASRAFADIGSHWCDLAEFITGERIASVCSQVAPVVPERSSRGSARAFEASDGDGNGRRAVTTEDLATVMFRTTSGVLGSLLVSQVSPERKNHLHIEVAGEQASVRFEQERPETLWVGRRERTEQLWRDATSLSPAAVRRRTARRARHRRGARLRRCRRVGGCLTRRPCSRCRGSARASSASR